MSGFQGAKLNISIIILFCLIIFGCSDVKIEQKKMNNFEKHLSELYDTEHVSVTFERRKNQTTNEAWPDSFDCAVVQIIDSPSLSKVLENDELFDTEYQKIKDFLRDSAETINPQIFSLALTVIDTVYSEANKIDSFSSTKLRSVEPTLVLEDSSNLVNK